MVLIPGEFGQIVRVALLLCAAGASCFVADGFAADVETLYRNYCSSCHGREMQGAMGPSLVDGVWVHGSSNEEIAAVIKNGVPRKGMPAWRKSLSDAQIRALVTLIRESAAQNPTQPEGAAMSEVYEAPPNQGDDKQ